MLVKTAAASALLGIVDTRYDPSSSRAIWREAANTRVAIHHEHMLHATLLLSGVVLVRHDSV
jgi:hypothetical protein